MPRRPDKRLFCITTLVALAATALPCAADDSARWDWVDIERLDPAQREQVGPGCRGLYVEPPRDWRHAGLSPDDAPLSASADRSRAAGEVIHLEGDVVLRKGNLSLRAGEAEYRRDTERLRLDHGVELRQPGLLLRGERADIDTHTGLGSVQEAQFLEHASGNRGLAGQIERPSEQTLHLESTRFTQCPPTQEMWSLNADRIRLDYESGRGVARNTTLRILDVPVFYTPWINFPVDDRRATGLLWPSIGTKDGSLDLSVPIYLNLAPNYDATLSPRLLERRGPMMESEFRYLNRFSQWQLAGAYLNNDRRFGDDRWLYGLDQRGLIAQRWQTRVDYTRVSDNDYFRDLDIASLDIKRATHLNQRAAVGYLGNRWRSQINVQQFQTIANVGEPYRRLPQVTLNYRAPTANFSLEPLLSFDYTRFDHRNSLADGGNRVTGDRRYAEAGLRFPMHWRAGHLVPAVKMRHVSYQLEAGAVERTPETTRPQASLDAGLIFERYFGKDAGWTQTLEPRLYYLYAQRKDNQQQQPNFDTVRLPFNYQQMFRDSRFSGLDRLDDANQLATGLSSRFISHERGREMLSIGVGQLFYFDDREVRLPGREVETHNRSDITGEARFYPTANSWLGLDLLWDQREDQISQTQLTWHYRGEDNSLYNLGYSLRRGNALGSGIDEPLEQLDASVALPLSLQWRVFARWQHDIGNNRRLENLLGVAYESCCWQVRLAWRRSLEPDDSSLSNVKVDRAVLLEFQFRGLGGVGDRITTALEESIFGYRER